VASIELEPKASGKFAVMTEGMLHLDFPPALSLLTPKPGTCLSTRGKEQTVAGKEPQAKGKKCL
jgi:hypothetical protein